MNIGIIVTNNDIETTWNAFRFGNFSLKNGDDVRVFLLDKGVECINQSAENLRYLSK